MLRQEASSVPEPSEAASVTILDPAAVQASRPGASLVRLVSQQVNAMLVMFSGCPV
jgi:hypothetical protein